MKKNYDKVRKKKKHKNKFIPRFLKENIFIPTGSIIGKYTSIGYGTNINGIAFIASSQEAPVTIGKYCAIAHNFRIRSKNHYTGYANLQTRFQIKYNFPSLESIKGSVVIGNNVWIGDNVIILSGVTVGDGAVIGAASVVTKDVPAYSIAVGNPARVIKKRFSDSIIEQLLQVEWWNWPEAKIKRNRIFFTKDLSKSNDLDISNIIVD